jgi:hypothetical protein
VAATSFVRDRGRAIGVVAALTATMALATGPAAFGADGDPIATSTLSFKLSGGFKAQLKANGVKMTPKKLKISNKGNSDVDPTNGKADLRLGKITFKKGNKKVVYGNVKGKMPGVLKGSSGKLFRLDAATVVRDGFGAKLSGIQVTFLAAAAKKINKKLGLDSLHAGKAANMKLAYQPETVRVLGGTSSTLSAPVNLSDPEFGGSVGAKLLLGHCVSGVGAGITPIAPATKEVLGGLGPVRFTFPVIGGDIAPDGTGGVTEQAGGLRLAKSESGGACASQPYGELTQVNLMTHIGERAVSSEVNIVAAPPGVLTGPRGRAFGQTIDPSATVRSVDPVNRTISLSGSLILLNATAAGTLNLVFPCHTNCDDNPPAGNLTMESGDPFGTSMLTVATR